jgi:hypothetical protein
VIFLQLYFWSVLERIKTTHFVWGIESPPWLILTDVEHVVTAEGFPISELDKKLNNRE